MWSVHPSVQHPSHVSLPPFPLPRPLCLCVPPWSPQFDYYNSVLINEKDESGAYVELGAEFVLEANAHFSNLMVNTTLSSVQLPTNVYNKGAHQAHLPPKEPPGAQIPSLLTMEGRREAIPLRPGRELTKPRVGALSMVSAWRGGVVNHICTCLCVCVCVRTCLAGEDWVLLPELPCTSFCNLAFQTQIF